MELEISLAELFSFRQLLASPCFEKELGDRTVRLILPYSEGWLYTDVEKYLPEDDPENPLNTPTDEYTLVQLYEPTFNKAVWVGEKRILSHDWGDITTWPQADNSHFILKAQSLTRFVVNQVIIRFPQTATIAENNAVHFEIYQSLDGMTPVDDETSSPIQQDVYPTFASLLMQCTSPVGMTIDAIPGAFTGKMIELMFLKNPIFLRSSLNERIECYMEGDLPIKTYDGNSLDDPCQVAFSILYMMDF